jgi:hypothetical protein
LPFEEHGDRTRELAGGRALIGAQRDRYHGVQPGILFRRRLLARLRRGCIHGDMQAMCGAALALWAPLPCESPSIWLRPARMVPNATERVVLSASAFLAGMLLLAPGERVSAYAAFTLAGGLGAWHLLLAWRERKR